MRAKASSGSIHGGGNVITSVRFENFKRLRDVTLALGRLNVIVGANGVGKTSVLEALDLVLQYQRDFSTGGARMHAALPGILSRPSATSAALTVATSEHDVVLRVARPPLSTPWVIDRQACGDQQAMEWLRSGPLPRATRCQFDVRVLAEPGAEPDDVPVLHPSGRGLPLVVQYHQGLRDGSLERMEQGLASIVPGARRVRALPARVGEETGARLEVEFDEVGWIRSEQLSEGTLLAVALCAAVRHDPAEVLLLDDIDRGLHPLAQQQVVALLRGILAEQPNLQIVATAHSPFVLDSLEATEVFVAGSAPAGGSRVRRLDTHPAWTEYANLLRSGEFWSMIGEGWVGQ